MKRIIAVVGIILFIVAGCAAKKPEVPSEKDVIEEDIQYEIEQLHVDSTEFRYVVDWLSNEEVLFVEEQDSKYKLRSFHVKTKEITTVYEEDEIITSVLVHPMKGHLLIHTSTEDSTATVKIMTLDGVVQNELIIESVELEIEWNDVNPLYLLFTAFYEDWSFDTFFFNCSNDALHMVDVDDPFPKWFGPEQFALLSQETGTGKIVLHQIETDEKVVMESDHVIQFSTFNDSLFMIEEVDNGRIRYAIVNTNDDLLTEEFEQSSDGSPEPTIEWLGEETVLLIRPDSDVDRVTKQSSLLMFDPSGLTMLMDDVVDAPIKCSPDGEYCLTGTSFEKVLHMKTQEEELWLIYDDVPFNENKQ